MFWHRNLITFIEQNNNSDRKILKKKNQKNYNYSKTQFKINWFLFNLFFFILHYERLLLLLLLFKQVEQVYNK